MCIDPPNTECIGLTIKLCAFLFINFITDNNQSSNKNVKCTYLFFFLDLDI